ncbi:STAS domain-containing protein [Luteitalea sp. TBR-22]|uniref:STAS domain-containing protein n=1 Tax=Luteitalea sp. TBR-22 TaxID=2802971 RepID=UPI001EF6143A|nr:STAS domain-containing protein [Luteitalea sp. TBR-22]
MATSQSHAPGSRLVLSPQEALVAGGPAEELERRIQGLFREGYRHVVVDLRAVPTADSAGVRALVRGHTSAQRLNRRFTLISPNPHVREVLTLSLLDGVLEVKDSVADAKAQDVRWDRILTLTGVLVVGVGLVGTGMVWPTLGLPTATAPAAGSPFVASPPGGFDHPLFELAKLVASALIGMLVTVVHRQNRSDRSPNPTMDQAQVLLCVSGALMMVLIGNNLARAFGIAGAASVIRFRTPVEDARDITILFILMGLGMAAGLGAFAVAGLGTLFLCALLPMLNLLSADRPRSMLVEIVAEGRELPMSHIHQVFAINGIVFEPREVSQGDEATARYLTNLGPGDSIEDLSAQLMADGRASIKHVSWSPPKRG